jgi:hypothetical protein
MTKTQTLQREVTRLPKRVAGRFDSFELPSRKRKRTPPSAVQIGAAVGAIAVVTSALVIGRTVRNRMRRSKD